MIDLIGKRRYGYLLSATAMIVGVIFILATLIPNGNVGLQFSIAYTGGTVWEVHFADGTPDPNAVRAVLDEVGLSGEVAITQANDMEFVLIRTEELALQEPELAEGSVAAAQAAASAEADASAQPEASAEADASVQPEASAEAEATAAAAVASPEADEAPAETDGAATADPDASPAASPEADVAIAPSEDGADGGTSAAVPTEGRFGELAAALQGEFGPIDEVRQENSVGPIVSQELIYQTFLLVLMAAGAIMVWVAYRFRDFRMGVTALAGVAPRRHHRGRRVRDPGHVHRAPDRQPLRDRHAHRHRLLGARHHRGLRPYP